ncbi:MAG: dihydropteroate synthase [Parvularculaceae bacterium]|nr:dihydropteroate synthase [Parvularculaceae bacterium]
MKILGIVNVTPDSFSDGGLHFQTQQAVDHALRLEDEGAHILDIGGESTRPGAPTVPDDQELTRVLPVIEALAGRVEATLSIDTRKPKVVQAAVAAGAGLWNDVTALRYAEESVEVAAKLGCDVALMHMLGEPGTMQQDPTYSDVVSEVKEFLEERMATCEQAGIARDRLIIDPGIGFGKTLDHNLALFRELETFTDLGVRTLLGASRKRFIAALDRASDAADRVGGSLAAALRGAQAGFTHVRVHDVAATRQALAVASAIGEAADA